ncbi:MAG: hypothetical protein ACOX7H_05415 [Bacillota bacterium]|jgi:hypothetical protein
MKKLALIMCLAIAVIALAACGGADSELSGGESKGDPLLTQSADNVESIVVYDQSTGNSVTLNKDNEQMSALVNALAATKTKTSDTGIADTQLSNPKYMLDINYKDNKLENIFSTKTGETYFRFINEDTGWIGGQNADAMKIIDGLFAPAK